MSDRVWLSHQVVLRLAGAAAVVVVPEAVDVALVAHQARAAHEHLHRVAIALAVEPGLLRTPRPGAAAEARGHRLGHGATEHTELDRSVGTAHRRIGLRDDRAARRAVEAWRKTGAR